MAQRETMVCHILMPYAGDDPTQTYPVQMSFLLPEDEAEKNEYLEKAQHALVLSGLDNGWARNFWVPARFGLTEHNFIHEDGSLGYAYIKYDPVTLRPDAVHSRNQDEWCNDVYGFCRYGISYADFIKKDQFSHLVNFRVNPDQENDMVILDGDAALALYAENQALCALPFQKEHGFVIRPAAYF